MLEYVCQAFHSSLPQYLSDDIEYIQKRALRIIYQDLSCTGILKRACCVRSCSQTFFQIHTINWPNCYLLKIETRITKYIIESLILRGQRLIDLKIVLSCTKQQLLIFIVSNLCITSYCNHF